MNKATQLLLISVVTSLFIILVSRDDWSKFHAVKVAEAKILSITAGDTMKALVSGKQEDIKLAYINCPSTDVTAGMDALNTLQDSIKNRQIRLNIVDIDENDRKISEVYANDKNINLYLIRTGKCFLNLENDMKKSNYLNAEQEAKRKKLGIHKEQTS